MDGIRATWGSCLGKVSSFPGNRVYFIGSERDCLFWEYTEMQAAQGHAGNKAADPFPTTPKSAAPSPRAKQTFPAQGSTATVGRAKVSGTYQHIRMLCKIKVEVHSTFTPATFV